MSKRKKIPTKVEAKLIFDNDNTCCMCREIHKGVSHHIDEDSSDNEPSNLAVLCATCHDKVHKKGGTTRGLSPHVVRQYKRDWESLVNAKRALPIRKASSSKITARALFEFEIRTKFYEFCSLNEGMKEALSEKLEFLYQLAFQEGRYYSKYVLSIFRMSAILVAFEDRKSSLICLSVPKFLCHLVGPDYVKLRRTEKEMLRDAIDIIETVGEFSANFRKSIDVIKSACRALREILEVCLRYKSLDHFKMIMHALGVIRVKWKLPGEKVKKEVRKLGISYMNSILKKMRKDIEGMGSAWYAALENE